MDTTYHLQLNIEGALAVPIRTFRRQWKGCVIGDDGQLLTPDAFRAHLHRQQAKGHKLEPCSRECVGFDPFGKGCPGHPVLESGG